MAMKQYEIVETPIEVKNTWIMCFILQLVQLQFSRGTFGSGRMA